MLHPPSAEAKKLLEAATAEYEGNRSSVLPYLERRGISPATAERFRLGRVGTSPTDRRHAWFAGRLAIPAIGPNGVQSIRFRCLDDHDCHEVDCKKYLGVSGEPTRPFNLRAVTEADDVIVIAEGEMDSIIINQCGIPAVGITGVTSWKKHYPRIFTGFPRVIVIGDNDKKGQGQKFANEVAKTMWNATPRIVGSLAEDVTDFYTREGKAALVAAILDT